jgi:hypothetical protein
MAEESGESERRRWGVRDVPVYAVTILVYAAFLFVLWPLLIYVWIRHARDERRTRRQLAAEGRLLNWDQARERMLAGNGMLVVELMAPSGYGHIWWIDAQRLAEHPSCPLPEFREPRSRALYESFFSGPVADWCREHLTVLLETSARVDGRMPKDFDEGLPPERVRVVWESWAGGPQSAFTPKPMPPLRKDL